MRSAAFGFVLLAASAFSDDTTSRSKVIGSWEPQDSSAKEEGVWTLEKRGDDALHIAHLVGGQIICEFECNTNGRDCEVKDSGKPAKVTLWYNGSKLVELETKGRDVLKRRFAVTGEGDTLELEVIPIVPESKAETLHFRRVRP
jgi:hypothetical protein